MDRRKTATGPAVREPGAAEGPAAIYAHIPFCRTKCPYCSFVSYPGMDAEFMDSYMDALAVQAEFLSVHPWTSGTKFHSLYIGGGTPTVIDPGKMSAFVATCLKRFTFAAESGRAVEISMEANPNTVSRNMLKQLRTAGINRLSLGIQSFSDRLLHVIGRKHTEEDNIKAYRSARAAGFANINLDLMYGLPGQRIEAWEKTLRQVVALAPEHLSVYELTVEPDTPFAERAGSGELDLPHEDETLAMFTRAREILADAGYKHYEISNYARPGFECIHNITYWKNYSYIGLGTGAVSCFGGVRIKNEADPERFIHLLDQRRSPYAEAEFLPLLARFRETVIMGLRMIEGVSVDDLEKRFGVSVQECYGEIVMQLQEQGLLLNENRRLRLTPRGLVLANRVMAQLV